MGIEKAKTLVNNKKVAKKKRNTSGIGWEIGAYATRGVSVLIPAVVIMTLEGSWVKNGLGLLATLLIIAMLIIFKKPIKSASNYAPGVIPFTAFIVIAIFFNTTAKALLTVGISGLTGSIAAIPFHLKYLSYSKTEDSQVLELLNTLTNKLK